jgi:hypothetical protein
MSYEYSSESKRLDLPNPFKIENYFLILTAFILIASAIWLLIIGRGAIASGNGPNSYLPTIIGILMLMSGLSYCGWALSQLRFYFGRDEPKNITIVNPISTNNASTVDGLRETVRQNALSYPEPIGALNGLLYSKIPNLIFSPVPIQQFAQRQFHNLLSIIAILLSLLICLASLDDEKSVIWMSLFFFSISMVIVAKYIKNRSNLNAQLGVKGLISLIVIAILSPVLLPKITQSLPTVNFPNLTVHTLTFLILSLIAITLFFVALVKQMVPPPKTTSACNQQSFSMNCSPVQIIDEADRVLLKSWTEQIPNRAYSRITPTITHGAMNTVGEFTGEVLEETQPMPNDELRKLSLQSALESPRYRGLVWLDCLGLFITLFGVGFVVYFVNSYDVLNMQMKEISILIFGVSLIVLGTFCFKSAHRLWGRFDFVSKLTWIEMIGNYQSAKMDYGNVISDRIKTEKQIINVENMTLRVWVCEIDSMALNKDQPRYLTAMRGLNDDSTNLASHLIQFAKNQSIIVAPESQIDRQKLDAMSALNQTDQPKIEQTSDQVNLITATLKSACTQCGNTLSMGSNFCGQCGSKVV